MRAFGRADSHSGDIHSRKLLSVSLAAAYFIENDGPVTPVQFSGGSVPTYPNLRNRFSIAGFQIQNPWT